MANKTVVSDSNQQMNNAFQPAPNTQAQKGYVIANEKVSNYQQQPVQSNLPAETAFFNNNVQEFRPTKLPIQTAPVVDSSKVIAQVVPKKVEVKADVDGDTKIINDLIKKIKDNSNRITVDAFMAFKDLKICKKSPKTFH